MLKFSSPIVSWSEFLSPEMVNMVRNETRTHKSNFVPTTVSTGEAGHRSSMVLWHYHYEELKRHFTNRIHEVMPALLEEMGDYCLQTAIQNVEVQMTVHYRNGDMFKKHVDSGTADTASRRVTYVYYYNLGQTQQYSGGELLIYLQNGVRTVIPAHNSVIFFPSHLYHEVVPVHVPTQHFENGRFTLNGWIH